MTAPRLLGHDRHRRRTGALVRCHPKHRSHWYARCSCLGRLVLSRLCMRASAISASTRVRYRCLRQRLPDRLPLMPTQRDEVIRARTRAARARSAGSSRGSEPPAEGSSPPTVVCPPLIRGSRLRAARGQRKMRRTYPQPLGERITHDPAQATRLIEGRFAGAQGDHATYSGAWFGLVQPRWLNGMPFIHSSLRACQARA